MGVASYPVDSRTKEGLLHLADEAMYLAKNTNRDSVAVANVGILERCLQLTPNPRDSKWFLLVFRSWPLLSSVTPKFSFRRFNSWSAHSCDLEVRLPANGTLKSYQSRSVRITA